MRLVAKVIKGIELPEVSLNRERRLRRCQVSLNVGSVKDG